MRRDRARNREGTSRRRREVHTSSRLPPLSCASRMTPDVDGPKTPPIGQVFGPSTLGCDGRVTGAWTSRRKRHVPVDFLTGPSRPGRLMAVTACPDRHETPGTHLGRPRRPKHARPSHPRPARPPRPAPPRRPTNQPLQQPRRPNLQALDPCALILGPGDQGVEVGGGVTRRRARPSRCQRRSLPVIPSSSSSSSTTRLSGE